METCLLIPPELVVCERKTKLSGGVQVAEDGRDNTTTCLGVFSVVSLHPGCAFYATSGASLFTRIDYQTKLRSLDVRNGFGCFDVVRGMNGHSVRHCNWVRFVQNVSKAEDANIVATKIRGQPIYQVIKMIPAGTELLVYFSTTDHSVNSILDNTKLLPPTLLPLNLSLWQQTKPISLATDFQPNISSPSTTMENTFNLITPPPEEDRKGHSTLLDNHARYTQIQDGTSDGRRYTSIGRTSGNRGYIGSVRRNKERAMLPCEVCSKVFDRPSLLKRHMRTHTGERPHRCNICCKAFSTSSSLNTHQRIHSGEKPHVCNVCGKRFTASSNLYYHKMTHQKEKPHKCRLCSKSFPTPGDLKCHMYIHNGSWPYKCGLCNRGFSKQTNLRNHLMLHTGERPYECNQCGKRFALPCNLKAHVKTHDGTKMSRCSTCNKTCPSSELSNQNTCNNCTPPLTSASNQIPPYKVEDIGADFKSKKQCGEDYMSGRAHVGNTFPEKKLNSDATKQMSCMPSYTSPSNPSVAHQNGRFLQQCSTNLNVQANRKLHEISSLSAGIFSQYFAK